MKHVTQHCTHFKSCTHNSWNIKVPPNGYSQRIWPLKFGSCSSRRKIVDYQGCGVRGGPKGFDHSENIISLGELHHLWDVWIKQSVTAVSRVKLTLSTWRKMTLLWPRPVPKQRSTQMATLLTGTSWAATMRLWRWTLPRQLQMKPVTKFEQISKF